MRWLLLALCGCGFETVAGPPDLAGIPCTILPAGGCGPGQKCAWFAGGTVCQPDGTVPPGGRCLTSRDSDDCLAGAECDFVSGDGIGVCAPYCASDGNCSSLSLGATNPSRCRFPSGEPARCSVPCDPHGKTCPTSEFGCSLILAGPHAVTECLASPGGAVPGAACTNLSDCADGVACINSMCRTICAPTEAPCPTGSCVTGALDDNYGVCL